MTLTLSSRRWITKLARTKTDHRKLVASILKAANRQTYLRNKIQSQLLTLHPNQQKIADSKAKYRVAVCGRRFGKTEVGKYEILNIAAAGGKCWWLAPVYKEAKGVWDSMLVMLRPILSELKLSRAFFEIHFPNGGFIRVESASNEDTLRGSGLDFVVLDEVAFMSDTVWPSVIQPMLLDRKGRALFLSTPNGHNHLFDYYQSGLDPQLSQWEAFHFTSYSNPNIDPADIDEIKAGKLDAIFREEYMAEFLDDSGTVFRNLRARAVVEPGSEKYDPAAVYVAGIDWGREVDSTVIVVFNASTARMVDMDRFNQVGWSFQRGRVKAMAEKWNLSYILAEHNSTGDVNIEALQQEGLPVYPFVTSNASKPPLIEGWALALERGAVDILDEPVLISEHLSFRMRRMPGGGYKYEAPAGQHDDTVIAAALAFEAMNRPIERVVYDNSYRVNIGF